MSDIFRTQPGQASKVYEANGGSEDWESYRRVGNIAAKDCGYNQQST